MQSREGIVHTSEEREWPTTTSAESNATLSVQGLGEGPGDIVGAYVEEATRRP